MRPPSGSSPDKAPQTEPLVTRRPYGARKACARRPPHHRVLAVLCAPRPRRQLALDLPRCVDDKDPLVVLDVSRELADAPDVLQLRQVALVNGVGPIDAARRSDEYGRVAQRERHGCAVDGQLDGGSVHRLRFFRPDPICLGRLSGHTVQVGEGRALVCVGVGWHVFGLLERDVSRMDSPPAFGYLALALALAVSHNHRQGARSDPAVRRLHASQAAEHAAQDEFGPPVRPVFQHETGTEVHWRPETRQARRRRHEGAHDGEDEGIPGEHRPEQPVSQLETDGGPGAQARVRVLDVAPHLAQGRPRHQLREADQALHLPLVDQAEHLDVVLLGVRDPDEDAVDPALRRRDRGDDAYAVVPERDAAFPRHEQLELVGEHHLEEEVGEPEAAPIAGGRESRGCQAPGGAEVLEDVGPVQRGENLRDLSLRRLPPPSRGVAGRREGAGADERLDILPDLLFVPPRELALDLQQAQPVDEEYELVSGELPQRGPDPLAVVLLVCACPVAEIGRVTLHRPRAGVPALVLFCSPKERASPLLPCAK
ncbi:hypothetical protein CSUB01_08369 [Colletotrichum sublineola]|uniref:Uncharacterized protein n=1 Tax=Colletotrichum sublineola TaxID=1173701 RepID=A0A066X409_COLSU|nr:hypothetical protein CSUB01_08369 [Colletotrichum sublineola]